MEGLSTILEQILTLLLAGFLGVLSMPTNPAHHLGWPHLLGAAYIAALLYLARTRRARDGPTPSFAGFVRFCFPRSVWSQSSAWLDVRFFFVNTTLLFVMIALLAPHLPALTTAGASWSDALRGGISPPFKTIPTGYVATFSLTLVSTLWIDFTAYAIHYSQHRIPWLWEFHKVHHSAPVMHPLTNYREHLVDNLVAVAVAALAVGLFAGAFALLFEDRELLASPRVMGVPLFVFLYNVLGYNLRHSHIWWAWPTAVGRVLGSPANHQIHHSREARHLNKNFGFLFAIWDWMFGTLYLPPREREEFELGLAGESKPEYDSVLRLYFLPFVKLARRVRPGD